MQYDVGSHYYWHLVEALSQKVITTKVEAREYQQHTAAVSRPVVRRNITRNTRERSRYRT
jgi:hypothetical protein